MSHATNALESSVLGAVLTRPTPDRSAELMASLTLEPDDFQHHRNRVVWQAMRTLERSSTPIDVSTLVAEIEQMGHLDAIGGIAYLSELAMNVPTTDNALEYAAQVRDRALARRVLVSLDELRGRYRADAAASGAEVLTDLFASVAGFDAEMPNDARTIGELARLRARDLEALLSSPNKRSGFPTGVDSLDKVIGGVQPGIVTIVAARPGMGKSSLGLAMADAASSAGYGVHVLSLEDTREAYTDRCISRISAVPSEVIRSGEYQDGQFRGISAAMTALKTRKGWLVDDRSGITAEEAVRSVRRSKRENATKVVIVDYVQLLRWPKQSKSAHEALTAGITTLADAAKQDGMAYVVMSQLNRGVEQRADKRPMLADLRESGSLEERAKCVVALYRGSYYGEPVKGVDYQDGETAPSADEFKRQATCLVLKNSNGRTGEVSARWDGPTTRIW